MSVATPRAEEADGPAGDAEDRLEQALRSGRFVLGERVLHPLGPHLAGTPGPGPQRRAVGALPPATVVEVCTREEASLTPVRVTAPGLARALDRWALRQPGTGDPGAPAPLLVVRLQPGGVLGLDLEEDLEDLLRRRPVTRIVLQVPEDRLEEAVSAQRALLARLSRLGVGLAVAGWSGRLDVRALVRLRVELVQLAPACQEDVLRPEGAALLTGLVAGLAAGLGPTVRVVAEEPRDAGVARALAACGVAWVASPAGAAEEAA